VTMYFIDIYYRNFMGLLINKRLQPVFIHLIILEAELLAGPFPFPNGSPSSLSKRLLLTEEGDTGGLSWANFLLNGIGMSKVGVGKPRSEKS